MQNALDNAVRRIKEEIPPEILNETFLVKGNRFRQVRHAASVDSLIKELVIVDSVLTDCNLIGGNEVDIRIRGEWCERIDQNAFIVSIPKTETQNRSISSIKSVDYIQQSGYNSQYANTQVASEYVNSLSKLVNNTKNPTLTRSIEYQVINENTISVMSSVADPSYLFATVMLDYDEQMSLLPPVFFEFFARLCMLATKRYIWVNRITAMDRSEISGGFDLNRYTSIIEDYSEAATEYREYFDEKWRKMSYMADSRRKTKHDQMISRLGL